MNFQMFKLDLEKTEEPEIKLPTSVVSKKKQESSRKTSTSALLTTPMPLTVWITTNWKILQQMGISDHLTCLLRNVYAGQEATVRTGHETTTDWFQIGKGVRQGCILSPCLFTSMQSTSWEMLGWKKHKLESRFPGEISITSDTQMIPPFWLAESEEELKSLLMKVKKDSENVGLKLNIQKTKIIASGPITSWQKDGETVETVRDFIWGGGSKITADGD